MKCFSNEEINEKVSSRVIDELSEIISVADEATDMNELLEKNIPSLIQKYIALGYTEDGETIDSDRDTQNNVMNAISVAASDVSTALSMMFDEESGVKYDMSNEDKQLIFNSLINTGVSSNNVIQEDGIHVIDLFDQNNNSITSFMEKAYGSQEAPYRRMESLFNDSLFNALIINGTGYNATPVSPYDIKWNLAAMKLRFMADILSFIDSKTGSDHSDKIELYNSISDTLENNDVTYTLKNKEVSKIDNYNEMKNVLDEFKKAFSESEMFKSSRLSSYAVSGNKDDLNSLNVYNKVFILNNLDKLIEMKFENIFDISNINSKMILKDISFSDSMSNIHTTWLDNEDVISAYKEAGSMTKLILGSMSYYNGNSKTSRKLRFNEINDAIGLLKQSSWENIDFTLTVNGSLFEMPDGSVPTLRDIIENFNTDSQLYLETITRLINSEATVNDGNEMTIPEFIATSVIKSGANGRNEARIKSAVNNINSLFKNIYDMGLISSFDKSIDPRYINYFSYVANYIQGAYRNNYIQRYVDKDGNISSISLSDKPYELARMKFKSDVYSSSVAIINNLNRYASELQNRYSDSYPKDSNGKNLQFRIEHNFISKDGNVQFDENGSYVRFMNLPIEKDGSVNLFNITVKFDGTNMDNTVDINVNGTNVNSVDKMEIFSNYTNSGEPTSFDKIFQSIYQINTINNSELRSYLYKGRTSLYNLFKGAMITSAISYINNEVYSDSTKFKSSESIQDDISKRSQTGKYTLIPGGRRGVSNLPSFILNVENMILEAIAVNNNMLSRDTVTDSGGNQLAITNMQRSSNSLDEQRSNIRSDKESAASRNVMTMRLNELNDVIGSRFDSNEMIFLGNDIERETSINGESKDRSDFNVSECLTADIFMSYFDEISEDGNSPYTFVTSVNSDKSLVNRSKINRKFIEILRNKDNVESMKKEGVDYNLIVSASKARRYHIISEVNKRIYGKLIENIKSDFDRMFSTALYHFDNSGNIKTPLQAINDGYFIKSDFEKNFTLEEETMLNTIIGYISLNQIDINFLSDIFNNNFSVFNEILDAVNIKDGYKALMTIAKYVNYRNKVSGIKDRVNLIDQTHVVKFKDARGNTRVSANNAIMLEYATYNDVDEDILNRFKLSNLGKPGFIKVENIKDVFERNAVDSVLYAIIDNDFEVKLSNESGEYIKTKGFMNVIPEMVRNGWADSQNVFLLKLKDNNGNVTNVRSIDDLIKVGVVDADGRLNTDVLGMRFGIEVNPLLEEYSTIHSFISEQTINFEVGGRYNHPIKGVATTANKLRSALQLAQTKRNVSITASYHPLTMNCLDGLGEEIEIACISDIEENKSSYIGNNKKISPHDGATFFSPLTYYWWNGSMADTVSKGFNLKPFIHFYNPRTMTAGIIKTAGFPITNNFLRQGPNVMNMARRFLANEWRDVNGNPIIGNIFKDYTFRIFKANGESRDLSTYMIDKYDGKLFVRKSKNEYLRIAGISYKGDNNYEIKYEPVDVRGNKIGDYVFDEMNISSNFDLWKAFGAEQSMQLNEDGVLEYGENSFKIVADIANNVGMGMKGEKITSGNLSKYRTQKSVYQFMKHGNAHMFVTNGAIKQGMENMNDHKDVYFGKRGMPNLFSIRMTTGGIQLDKSHSAEGHEISELTQVISSLSSMGFTKDKASDVYNAISNIVESSLNNIIERHVDDNGNINYNDVSAELILRAMSESGAFDDDVRDSCSSLIMQYEKGFNVTYEQLSNTIHINDSVFSNKAIPIVMSLINKISIKKSYAGGLNVINPSYGLVQMFGGYLWNGLGVNDDERINSLISMQKESDMNKVSIHDVMPQHIYYIKTENGAFADDSGKTIAFTMNSHEDYKNLKKAYIDSLARGEEPTIHELFIRESYNDEEPDIEGSDNSKYKIFGRELAQDSYHITGIIKTTDENGNDSYKTNRYNMFDLDSTQFMFDAKNMNMNIREYLLNPDIHNRIRTAVKYMANYKYPDDFNMALMFENRITSMLYNLNSENELNSDYSDDVLASNFIKFARMYHQVTVENMSNAMNGKGMGYVIADGNVVYIRDKESVKYHAHEAIAPCIFREQFGIPKDTRIKDITPEFFARKMVSQMNVGLDHEFYHFALLHNSMRNTLFIYDASRFSTQKYTDVFASAEVVDGDYNFAKDEGSDYKWLLDSKGNKMYMIGNDDVVYKKDGKYIVVTNNPSRILKKHSYASIDISPSIYDNIGKREWSGKGINDRINSINNNVKEIFESAKYKYDNDGNVIEGSGSTTHMVYNEYGISVLDSVLDITREKAFAKLYNTNEERDYDLYVQKKILEKIDNGRLESMRTSVSSYEKMIYRNAISMYNSFRKTLEILAARTPSQTMQSFMSMEIAEFDNSGLNQCFVSTSQIWFQGSDFDIDAVNFQSHKVDRRGQYIGWSPLFDNFHLEESLSLPFPTGETYYMTKVSQEDSSPIFSKIFKIVEDENGIKSYERIEDASIYDIAQYIKECNNNKAIYVPVIEGAQDSAYDEVVNLVNSHNMYYNDNDVTNDGLKNNITENSISISKDPVNMIESESSVDDQTDVKDAGKKNTDAVRQLDNLTWNMTNTYSLGVNAQVGKDVVSITAAGLKNFYLITHYYNTINLSGLFKEVMSDGITDGDRVNAIGIIIRILSLGNGKGVEVGNKYYLTSSNFNPSEETKQMLNYIYNNYKDLVEKSENGGTLLKALENLVNACNYGIMDNDNALVLSALLSEATDNMKNLNLSKINATKDMAPLYIFGLTIGMTINDISNFMQSGTVKVIDKIKHGNIFYGSASKMSISDIYNRTISRKGRLSISSGMNKANTNILSNVHISSLNAIADKLIANNDKKGFAEVTSLINRVNEFSEKTKESRFNDASTITPMSIATNLSLYKSNYTNKNYEAKNYSVFDDYDLVIEILETFRKYSGLLNITGNRYTIDRENNLFLNWISKLVRAVNNRRIIEKEGNKIDAVISLDEGNKEMLKISLFASLNKGVKTTQTKLISYNTRMNDIFSFDSKPYGDKYPSLLTDDNPFVDRSKNTLYGFSLDKFVSNRRYASEAIDFYGEEVQHAFNVLHIAKTMPHISSYTRTADRANKIVNGMSPKKNIVNKIVDAYIIKLGYPLKEKDREALIREANKLVNSLIFNNWINNRKDGPIKFYIPVGCKYYKDTFGDISRLEMTTNNTGEPIEMYLGTNSGNASFIEWMNSIVIPNMKDGFSSDNKTSEYNVRSKFINDMNTFTSNKVYNDEDSPVYALPVNSRSNDEVDVMRKTEYKVSSINLGVMKYVSNSSSDGNSDSDIEYSAANLLYLYNQILYSGVMTNFSMDEYMDSSTLKNEYLSHEADVTSNEYRFMNVIGNFIMNDAIMMQMAPIGDGHTTSLKYSKYFDKDLMRNVLIKMSEKTNKNSGQENEDSIQNDNDESGIEEAVSVNRRGFDKSRYELVSGGSLRGVNSPKMVDDSVLKISRTEISTDGFNERKYKTVYKTNRGNKIEISDLGGPILVSSDDEYGVAAFYEEFGPDTEIGKMIQGVIKVGNRRRLAMLIDGIINNEVNCKNKL